MGESTFQLPPLQNEYTRSPPHLTPAPLPILPTSLRGREANAAAQGRVQQRRKRWKNARVAGLGRMYVCIQFVDLLLFVWFCVVHFRDPEVSGRGKENH